MYEDEFVELLVRVRKLGEAKRIEFMHYLKEIQQMFSEAE